MSLRIGFPVSVLGVPGIKSNDTRRWQSNPHLKTSLEYLERIFDYLEMSGISMYRMSSDLAPYSTHPEYSQFHNQVAESRGELKKLGRRALDLDLRLSFHPSQFIVLNSPDEALRKRSIWDLEVQADILDHMEQGPEAVLVIHAGGSYGDKAAGIDRWCATWNKLPPRVSSRLVLEHDDLRYSAADVLEIHRRTGVRLVFDIQHFWCLNPEKLELTATLRRFLATWPAGVRPKLHFSSPRTQMREAKRKSPKTGRRKLVLLPPVWTGHADFIHPFEFINFWRTVGPLDVDVMLEAKAKDLALLRLRKDLARYDGGDVATLFGVQMEAAENVAEEQEIEIDPAELSAE